MYRQHRQTMSWSFSTPARRLLSAVAVASLLGWQAPAHAFGTQSTADLHDQAVVIEVAPIPHFDKAHPEVTRFGRLEWRGGLVLTSPSSFFGGWSGLSIDVSGNRLLSVSDTGVWLTARLTYDGTRPAALSEARLGALRGADGKPLTRSRAQDAEGVAWLQGSLDKGEILVSFERNHRIVRYPLTNAGVGRPSAALELPPDTRKLEANKSLEAVCVLQAGAAKGSILTFAERYPSHDGRHVGWMRPALGGQQALGLKQANDMWTTIHVQTLDGYDITDCAGTPEGGIFLLERRFRVTYGDPLTGPKMRIRQISQTELMSGTTIAGETLIEANGAHEIDNMEGLAVHADVAGRTILTLISDDNFNSYLQRTVLLQFALVETLAPAVETPVVAKK